MGEVCSAIPTGKNSARKKRKQVQCPKCGSRVIDIALSTVMKIEALSKRSQAEPDFYTKCNNCGIELGIHKLG